MQANPVRPHPRPLRPKAETDEEISRTVQESQYARSWRMAAITQGDAAARSADRHRRAGLLPRLAGSEAQRRICREAATGNQSRSLPSAAARNRQLLRRASEAASQSIANGRAARGHQPGWARSRPAI